jgi:hypothetical protein
MVQAIGSTAGSADGSHSSSTTPGKLCHIIIGVTTKSICLGRFISFSLPVIMILLQYMYSGIYLATVFLLQMLLDHLFVVVVDVCCFVVVACLLRRPA